MMKLKYLYDNRELTMKLLNYWDYDNDSISIMDQYRISSTAIYPFKCNENIQMLRYSPREERTPEEIGAELEFIIYLKNEGYPVADIIASKNYNVMEVVDTPWGKYTASVFKKVKGTRLDTIALTDDIIYNLGCSLGKLHKLSRKYEPKKHRRISYIEQLDWMDMILSDFDNEKLALEEVKILREAMAGLEKTEANFGLIHYDFDLDNLFFDKESNTINVIDFDDTVYHWYVMDVVQSIKCISEELPNEKITDAKDLFIKGYKSVYQIDDELLKKENIFMRYDNLYGYVRVLRSISEPIDNQPEWMINLRKHVEKLMKKYSEKFGSAVTEK